MTQSSRGQESYRISEDTRSQFYQAADQIRPDHAELLPWVKKYRKEHAKRLIFDLQMFKNRVPESSKILELGAVPLFLTAAIAKLDYTVTSVDLAPERFSGTIKELGLDVKKCDIETEQLPFQDNSFDFILFNELFEHLRINPIKTMQEVFRVLKPNGHLFLSTPNLRSFRGIRNLIFKNLGHAVSPGGYTQYEKLDTYGHMGHVREYTTTEVSEFLERIGFVPDEIIFRGSHGPGLIKVAERLFPQYRLFFTIIASKPTQ